MIKLEKEGKTYQFESVAELAEYERLQAEKKQPEQEKIKRDVETAIESPVGDYGENEMKPCRNCGEPTENRVFCSRYCAGKYASSKHEPSQADRMLRELNEALKLRQLENPSHYDPDVVFGGQAKSERKRGKNLSKEIISAIRKDRRAGMRNVDIARKHGLNYHSVANHTKHMKKRINRNTIGDMFRDRLSGMSYAQIAKKYGINYKTVWANLNPKRN